MISTSSLLFSLIDLFIIINMRFFTVFLFLSAIIAVALASNVKDKVIRQVVEIHRLRPQTGTAGFPVPQLDCLSWRLAVEANNRRDWKLVPEQCENYVGHYMLGEQYRHDCEYVAKQAIEYAKSLKLSGDGKDVWVFDVDETILSNLPFFARYGFGAKPYNNTKFAEWILAGKLPAIPSMRCLYKTLLSLEIKPVLLTGGIEAFRESRTINLMEAGYSNWLKLILRGENDTGSAVEYKSGKRTGLVNAGYRIVGNIGDQWSDLIGENAGARTFKVPNPMYYVS